MSSIYTTPPANGEVRRDWYGGSIIETYRQRCTLVRGSDRFILGYQIPARSKVIAAMILPQTAVVTGTVGNTAGTATMHGAALWVADGTNATGLTGTVSNATASFLATASGGSTAFSNCPPVYDGYLNSSAPTATVRPWINTGTTPVNVVIVPFSTTSNRINLSSATTATNGYVFGTDTGTSTSNAGVVDVTITVMRFTDTGV